MTPADYFPGMSVRVKNAYNPDAPGTLICKVCASFICFCFVSLLTVSSSLSVKLRMNHIYCFLSTNGKYSWTFPHDPLPLFKIIPINHAVGLNLAYEALLPKLPLMYSASYSSYCKLPSCRTATCQTPWSQALSSRKMLPSLISRATTWLVRSDSCHVSSVHLRSIRCDGHVAVGITQLCHSSCDFSAWEHRFWNWVLSGTGMQCG